MYFWKFLLFFPDSVLSSQKHLHKISHYSEKQSDTVLISIVYNTTTNGSNHHQANVYYSLPFKPFNCINLVKPGLR